MHMIALSSPLIQNDQRSMHMTLEKAEVSAFRLVAATEAAEQMVGIDKEVDMDVPELLQTGR